MKRLFRSPQSNIFRYLWNPLPAWLTVTFGMGLLLSLGGCTFFSQQTREVTPSPTVDASPTAPTSPTPIPNQPFSAGETPIAASGKTTTVTMYKVDQLCEQLIPEKVSVAADRSLEAVVSKVIAQQSSADFNLVGYRVQVNPDRQEAVVDLRLAPGSKRRFASLSSCEQLALFGSLRRTLTSNSQWKIKTVKFTAQGQEIIL